MGKSLSIHPLTIIVVILGAGMVSHSFLLQFHYTLCQNISEQIFKYRQRIVDKANSNVKD